MYINPLPTHVQYNMCMYMVYVYNMVMGVHVGQCVRAIYCIRNLMMRDRKGV